VADQFKGITGCDRVIWVDEGGLAAGGTAVGGSLSTSPCWRVGLPAWLVDHSAVSWFTNHMTSHLPYGESPDKIVAELHDSETNEVLGDATNEQITHSLSTVEGHILVDADGNVVQPGTWAAQQPGVRKVYVA
jgi:hypothetical protein